MSHAGGRWRVCSFVVTAAVTMDKQPPPRLQPAPTHQRHAVISVLRSSSVRLGSRSWRQGPADPRRRLPAPGYDPSGAAAGATSYFGHPWSSSHMTQECHKHPAAALQLDRKAPHVVLALLAYADAPSSFASEAGELANGRACRASWLCAFSTAVRVGSPPGVHPVFFSMRVRRAWRVQSVACASSRRSLVPPHGRCNNYAVQTRAHTDVLCCCAVRGC